MNAANFECVKELELLPLTPLMRFLQQEGDDKRRTLFVSEYTSVASRNLEQVLARITKGFRLCSSAKSTQLIGDVEPKRRSNGLLSGIARKFSSKDAKEGREEGIDVVLESSLDPFLKSLLAEMSFEDRFFVNQQKPYQYFLHSLLQSLEKFAASHIEQCTSFTLLLKALEINNAQAKDASHIAIANFCERLQTRIKTRLSAVMRLQVQSLNAARAHQDCLRTIVANFSKCFEELKGSIQQSGELLEDALRQLTAAFDGYVERVAMNIQHSRLQSICLVTTYFALCNSLDNSKLLTSLLQEYTSRLDESVHVFCSEEIAAYFSEVVNVVKRSELSDESLILPSELLAIHVSFLDTLKSRLIVIRSGIKDAFENSECQAFVLSRLIGILMDVYQRFCAFVDKLGVKLEPPTVDDKVFLSIKL